MDTGPSTGRAPRSDRAPKYRSSCDACQAAKVKCGQEKPCCHRCNFQEFDCVYSLSRRMGRPRRFTKPGSDPQRNKETPLCNTPASMPEDERRHNQLSPPPERTVPVDTTLPPQGVRADSPMPVDESIQASQAAASHAQSPERMAEDHIIHSDMPCTFDQFDLSLQPQLDMTQFDIPHIEMDSHVLGMSIYPDASTTTTPSQAGFYPLSRDPLQYPPRMLQTMDAGRTKDTGSGRLPSGHQDHSCVYIDSIHESSRSLHIEGAANDKVHSKSNWKPEDDMVGRSTEEAANTSLGGGFDVGGIKVTSLCNSVWQDFTNSCSQLGSPITSGAATHVPFAAKEGAGLKRLSSPKSSDCYCYSSILDSIAASNHQQRGFSTMPVEKVLEVEKETRLILSKLLKCKSCSCDTMVHLLALICVIKTLDLLQMTVKCELTSQRRSSTYTTREYSGRASRRLRSGQGQTHETRFQSSSKERNLHVGKFKVSDEARQRFLTRILQARVQKLSTAVESLHSSFANFSQDSISRAASMLVDDIFRGLQTIAGLMELWDH